MLVLSVATTIASPAQTFTTLANFGAPHTGSSPDWGPLAQGFDGSFYGATTHGGIQGAGTAYKMGPGGKLTQLVKFGNNNGSSPYGGLAEATNGNLYGTTNEGGSNNDGTVFKMTPSGTLTTLHNFSGPDGSFPYATLIQTTDGSFYGTNVEGGANVSACNGFGCGTVFKITPSGELTTVYSFCSQTNCTDGAVPFAGLVQATDGNFYGTTTSGGAFVSECGGQGCGTVFKITPTGALTILYSFCSETNCNDGKNPDAALVQASDGSFYGTTFGGGANGYGTIFNVTSGGTLTTVYDFCSQSNCPDGRNPSAALIQATDGNLYGTTWAGGTASRGTIFKIKPSGSLTTLHTFNGIDGEVPYAGLVQAPDGKLYGTTSGGGTKGGGTIFSLAIGLAPFVESLPTSGKVGTSVKILGTKLTGTTAVSFNGVAATFTVVSGTEITATVPSGATTGFVTVTTPNGKLKSNKKFRVTEYS